MATEFRPDYAIHPGVFLQEEMEALKLSQKALAELTSYSPSVINEIIHGKRKINAELAVRLEKAVYSPAGYWLRLQALYDEVIARKKEEDEKTSVKNRRTSRIRQEKKRM